MDKRVFSWVFAFCMLNFAIAKFSGPNKKPDKKKATKINDFGKKLWSSRTPSHLEFPDELEFDFEFDVEDEPTIRTFSQRVDGAPDIPSFDSQGRKDIRSRLNQQFYVDGNGSYQVSAVARDDGSVQTELKATYRNGHGEKCFFARGESHCWRIDGEGVFGVVSRDGDYREEKSDSLPNVGEGRKKRQTGPLVYTDFTTNSSRVLKVVYVVDKAYIDWFIQLSGNTDTGLKDARDYIHMLNNEINYMYRGIKEVSESTGSIEDMDIVVYAKGFFYPAVGTDWDWLSPYVNGDSIVASSNRRDALYEFGRWVGNGNINQFAPFETATFVTPRRLVTNRGGGLLGIAYLSTVCDPTARFIKVSMNEDRFYDVALTAVHEIGHSLGSEHDSQGNTCPNVRHIMSASAFGITSTTRDTWNRWSTCSVEYIVNHVNSFPGCMLDGTISDDEFYDQLCKGTRGGNQFDINYQCKSASKVQSSVACSPSVTVNTGKVPNQACWDDEQISCTNANGICSDEIFTVYDGTPCEGTDQNKDYVCYRGDCLEKVNVCAGRASTANPTAQPTAAPPGTTPPAPPTTPPPSCTCTSGSRRDRRRCCRRTSNPDGSCCSGCRLNFRNRCVISGSIFGFF